MDMGVEEAVFADAGEFYSGVLEVEDLVKDHHAPVVDFDGLLFLVEYPPGLENI